MQQVLVGHQLHLKSGAVASACQVRTACIISGVAGSVVSQQRVSADLCVGITTVQGAHGLPLTMTFLHTTHHMQQNTLLLVIWCLLVVVQQTAGTQHSQCVKQGSRTDVKERCRVPAPMLGNMCSCLSSSAQRYFVVNCQDGKFDLWTCGILAQHS